MRKIHEWLAENVVYKYCGCFYSATHDHIFRFIQTKIPEEFLHRSIVDLGCGDGQNTRRVKEAFQAKDITGYDHNEFLIQKANDSGIPAKAFDLDRSLPDREMATFMFSLHHAKDKEKTLRQAVKKYKYIVLCEPMLDLYHRLFDAGTPEPREKWIALFDRVLKKYTLHQYKNNLLVFFTNKTK